MSLAAPLPTGPTGSARPRVRGLDRLKIATWSLLAICVMAIAVSLKGLAPIFEVGLVTAYCVIGSAVFYLLMRSGLAARFRDPACVFAHHLFILSALLLGCALIPQDRIASLQLFVLIWAFDIHRLSRRQLAIAGFASAGGLLVILLRASRVDSDDKEFESELISLVMVAFYLPVMVAISHVVRALRTWQTRQRAALDTALVQLQTLSKRDPLTGAANRRQALDALCRESVRQGRTQRPFSVGLLDLDFFKRINDGHGHAVGDAVLVETTRRLRESLPEEFTVARWGGEEFLVVMPDTPSAAAVEWMQRSRDSIASGGWSRIAPGLSVDVSVGVCEHRQAETNETTVERADRALYQAKEQGRGRVVEQSA